MSGDQKTGRPETGPAADERPSRMMEHSDVILERLLSLHPKVIDLSLGRVQRLLARLGHPERALPGVLHIAGTNGKGSTAAFLRAGLEAAGARVHVYTSPHLTRFHERIRLAGKLIEEGHLAALLAECERVNGATPITFFEITTAAAFLAFARERAEWCVLETGLGGRLDATNVVDAPALTLITPIGLDHQSFLGETIPEIAREKAGILKPGVRAMIGPQTGEALEAIETAADRVGAPISVFDRDWTARLEQGRLVVEDQNGLADLPAPRLAGRHQVANAGLAAASLRALGAPEEAIAAAMTNAEWPGRLQLLRRGPLVDAAPPGCRLWLDGGHNPDAAGALARHFADLEESDPAPLYLIAAMMNSKDAQGFFAPFEGLARRVFAAPLPGEPNALAPDDVAHAAIRAGLAAQTVGSIEAALRIIGAEILDDLKEPQPRVLICGSLYFAGRVLRENG